MPPTGAEGFSEATGQVAVSLVNGGSVSAGSAFVINFSQPVVDLGSVYVVCNGIGSSPFASGCQNILSVSWSTTPPGIQLTFNSTQAFTSDDQSEIVLTARVNVTSLLPAGGTVWASVTAETPATGALVSLGGANPVTGLEVLLVQTNPIYLDGLALTTSDVLTCIGAKDVSTYNKAFTLEVAEHFPTALTTASYEYSLDPDTGINGAPVGAVLTASTPPPGVGAWTSDIIPGVGSEFVITFSGVPAGVGIAVGDTIVNGPCNVTLTGTAWSSSTCTNTPSLMAHALSPTSVSSATAGQISFTFVVDMIDSAQAESLDIPFRFWSDGPLPPALSPNAITATVNYAPNTEVAGVPWFSNVTEPSKQTVIQFYDCVTNLLFPFVTNMMAGGGTAWNNLGTSLFVANTTADPFNTPGAVLASPLEVQGAAIPQSGACTFWLFPNLDNTWDGKAGTPAAWTSPTVQSGATIGFDLGSVAAFAGKTGYVFAQCGFQNAHGVEYISDNYALGEPGYAQAFQAIVIPTPELYHRSPAGDGLGESAVAPIAVDKLIQKLLSGGISNGYSVGGLF